MSLRKTFRIVLLIIIIFGSFAAWRIFGSNTNFDDASKSLFIKTGSSFSDVITDVEQQSIIKNPGTFKLVAQQSGYADNVKPGRYVIEKGTSIFRLIRILKSGRQTPVNFVLNKLRTKEDLAQKIGRLFECDSASFSNILFNKDSLTAYNLDTNTVMTAFIPNTYSILWNTAPTKLFRKLYTEQERFWTDERRKKAADLKLTPAQVYTLASIVEEETNKQDDKGKIASVYYNRMATGMRLGADPTVKYAIRDFGLKRIYNKHLTYVSPYNTYQNAGLPPGPICTPSIKTIDAVLDQPTTDYLYFVAKPDFRGYSNFASTYPEHLRYAKAYQMALDSLMKARL